MRIFELKDSSAFPYALVKIEGAAWPHVWLAVDRNYERHGPHRFDYRAHIDKAIAFRRDPREFDCWVGDTTGNYLYLFDTVHDAAADYEERLQRLLAEEWRPYRELLQ
jgi:hypothetical protein